MRIVVLGDRGQMGRVVAAHLRQIGHEVLGFDRADGLDILNDREPGGRLGGVLGKFRTAMTGASAVIHLAVNPTPPTHELLPPRMQDAEITGRVFDGAIVKDVPLVVFGSTIGISPAHRDRVPANYYAAAKIYGEALAQAFAETEGRAAVSLRLGAYGNAHLPASPEAWLLTDEGLRAWIDRALAHADRYACWDATDAALL